MCVTDTIFIKCKQCYIVPDTYRCVKKYFKTSERIQVKLIELRGMLRGLSRTGEARQSRGRWIKGNINFICRALNF